MRPYSPEGPELSDHTQTWRNALPNRPPADRGSPTARPSGCGASMLRASRGSRPDPLTRWPGPRRGAIATTKLTYRGAPRGACRRAATSPAAQVFTGQRGLPSSGQTGGRPHPRGAARMTAATTASPSRPRHGRVLATRDARAGRGHARDHHIRHGEPREHNYLQGPFGYEACCASRAPRGRHPVDQWSTILWHDESAHRNCRQRCRPPSG